MRAGEIISFECKSVTLCGLLAAWSGVQFVHLSLFIFIRCSLILRATVLRVQAVPSAALPQARQRRLFLRLRAAAPETISTPKFSIFESVWT